jgi:membrane-associated phospholipid phosphatase
MFQTELIKAMQSYATDGLTDFMVLVSRTGYSSFYIPVLILITFGLSFRKGFLLIQIMLWIGIITDVLKNVIAMPRPADVDSGVLLLKDNVPNPTPFLGKGGAGFWDLPDAETIDIIRSQPEWSYGLPSGNVSGATSFWGGLSLLFRYAPAKVVALAMITLMPLSRMYLGRHFLADVLGGFFLGIVILAAVNYLFLRRGACCRLLDLARIQLTTSPGSVVLLAYLILAPLILLLSPLIEAGDVGNLFGMNVAFLVLAMTGLPDDAGAWSKRAVRVVLAFALYLAAAKLTGMAVELSGLNEDARWIDFVAHAIPTFVVLWGGVKAGYALGVFRRV